MKYKDYVVVPQEDIDKLEEATKDLFELIKNDDRSLIKVFFHVSPAIWEITHRKYKKIVIPIKE